MKKLVFPPLYFFCSIGLAILCYWLFPSYQIILYPYNLLGVIPLIGGHLLMKRNSDVFNEKKTTFYLEKPTFFVQHKDYTFSRNPMYLGSLILITGLAFLVCNLISFFSPVLFFLVMNFLCIPQEEKLMEKTFGVDYLAYKKKIRRWI